MGGKAVAMRFGGYRSRVWLMPVTVAVLLSQAGCATITRGTTDQVWFESIPPGARVNLEPPSFDCLTPCARELKRKQEYLVHFEKEGYVPAQVLLSPKFGGAGAAGFAGNILLGGLIGMGVDTATGAAKVLQPNPVRITLVPVAAPPVPLPIRADVTEQAAPPVATLLTPPHATSAAVPAQTSGSPAEPGANCIQPAIVDREICLGRLRLGMARPEVIALFGAPDGTSRDQLTFRYGDRYLKFDATDTVVAISDKPK